jgi:hypothetical protein
MCHGMCYYIWLSETKRSIMRIIQKSSVLARFVLKKLCEYAMVDCEVTFISLNGSCRSGGATL